jgi:hypothetical protein
MIRSVNNIIARFSLVRGTIFPGLIRTACLVMLFLPGYAHATRFVAIFHPQDPTQVQNFLWAELYIAAFILACAVLSQVLAVIGYALGYFGRALWATLFRNR